MTFFNQWSIFNDYLISKLVALTSYLSNTLKNGRDFFFFFEVIIYPWF
jgi:hypothetical protein